MEVDTPQISPQSVAWGKDQGRWGGGWRRHVFPYVFMAYLAETAGGVLQYSKGPGVMAGLAILAGFCACYVIAIPWAIDYPKSQRLRWLLVVLIVLCGAEVPFARADSFVMGVFVVVPAIAALGNRSWPIVAAAIAAPLIVPPAVASWHTGPAVETTASSALTALALYAFFQVLGANRALSQAQREIARLAAENERARISRDLHDLLGHSLTTITVKAGLARRLGGSDPGRAQQEIAEVEDLARRALQEVRSAVSGDHTMTLGTELAKAREILSAAGISAELPRASDLVDAGHQELFAWVVREGVTNVVRHAHATTCSVHLAPGAIEIVDDGTGGEVTEGSGLRGLRSRVEAAGGRLDASRCPKGGWRLQVTVPLPAREAT